MGFPAPPPRETVIRRGVRGRVRQPSGVRCASGAWCVGWVGVRGRAGGCGGGWWWLFRWCAGGEGGFCEVAELGPGV